MAADSPLMQLGEFQFSLVNGVHQSLDRKLSWRWPEQARILRKPALQFTGPSADVITLDGVIYPSHSGRQRTIDDLRAMADEGKPYMLTDGLGRVYGLVAIVAITEKRTLFLDTNAARRIEFQIQLTEYGPDNPGERANPLTSTKFSGYASKAAQAANFTPVQTGPGSAYQILDWTTSADFLATSTIARDRGFTTGDLGFLSSQVSEPNKPQLSGALTSMGLSTLSPTQSDGWASAGLSATGMVEQMAAGRGPSVVSAALGQLQGLGGPQLQSTIAAVAGGSTPAMQDITRAAGSIIPGLNIDPKITSGVLSAILN